MNIISIIFSRKKGSVSKEVKAAHRSGYLHYLRAKAANHCAWPTISASYKPLERLLMMNPLLEEEEDSLQISRSNSAAIAAGKTAPNNHNLTAIIRCACEAVMEKESELNKLDAFVGDGDTGSQASIGASAVLDLIRTNALPTGNLYQLFNAISRTYSRNVGGSLGVVLGILFSSMAAVFKQHNNIDSQKRLVATAFQKGLKEVLKNLLL